MDPSSSASAAEPVDVVLSRWSSSNVHSPKSCLSPRTENELIQAMRYASDNGLTIVAEGGGTGAFVPVTEKTVYVRMRHFGTLEYNESDQTVTVGGGVRTGQILRFLAARGVYTVLPSSDEVGVVGFVLGGGGVSRSSLPLPQHLFAITSLRNASSFLSFHSFCPFSFSIFR